MRRPATATPSSVKRARTSGGPPQSRRRSSTTRSRATMSSSVTPSSFLRKMPTFVTSFGCVQGEIPVLETPVTRMRLRRFGRSGGQFAPPGVESVRLELGAEGGDRLLLVGREDVLDDADPAVVVERD